ncbi:ribosomal-protein-serine acetyltransferase [Dulcicalothrix desertica PCC 7102]|uniref:Ribosomal-protein-serine acetyltransferase n=1 Tax=Dulcicalothrix desertica PCC 7102 TaxID=232991 RepID=A0A3S1AGR6_9CYAN|nr:GNAT family protein [Dulcicalothrix desertica]RUT00164.1 ribosomal-protein-serine acetyltransferase [Dulcicalothrix desertica PCC 7102]TWH55631.1 ribosomal-protein-serine acetyltransferase [Dulcicalothrix desertica PCC 7102]
MQITIEVNSHLRIESVQELYAKELYLLVTKNYEYLKIYLPAVLMINSFDSALEHIRDCQNLASKNELLEFHVFCKNQLCGAMRLNNFEHENRKASIAYFVSQEFQNQGIITQSAKALIKYAFTQLKLHRIELRCVTTNQPSISVAKKLGFIREGELRDAEYLNGYFVNHYIYSLLSQECLYD